jgi:hypothetical protein
LDSCRGICSEPLQHDADHGVADEGGQEANTEIMIEGCLSCLEEFGCATAKIISVRQLNFASLA